MKTKEKIAKVIGVICNILLIIAFFLLCIKYPQHLDYLWFGLGFLSWLVFIVIITIKHSLPLLIKSISQDPMIIIPCFLSMFLGIFTALITTMAFILVKNDDKISPATIHPDH